MIKSGFTAIIGRPNVGKSTLMNKLIDMKIAITSSRAQTTRKEIKTIYTDDRGQIIFLDTPGITRADSKLGEYMYSAAVDTLKTADTAMWIVEPTTFIGAGERKIVEVLAKAAVPVLLVINKADTANEEQIGKAVMAYKAVLEEAGVKPAGANNFEDKAGNNPIAVSAVNGDGTDKLMDKLFEILPEGPMYYDSEEVTEETERDIAAEFIREKCLKFLDKEVPHGIAVIVDSMKERPDGSLVDIEATIICERDSHKGIIIGKGGATLKRIGIAARKDIEEMLGSKVNLKIWVKVRRDWKNNSLKLNEYGYR
jgi:GTP-binding protein Era